MSIRLRDFYLAPNLLSLGRIFAIPVIIAFLYFQWNLWALAVFIMTGLSDYADGWVARKFKAESKLGMLLDPLADKLIILSIMIMLLWQNRLNPAVHFQHSEIIGPLLVIVTVGREIGITGLRAIASTAGIVVPADRGGKIKTWIQFVAISFLIVNQKYFLEIGQVLLSLSVFAALWSGGRYVFYFLKGLPE